MAISFEGIGAERATYHIDGVTIVYDGTKIGGAAATMIGKAVSLSADETVQLASDAEAIEGKLISVEADGECSVQYRGFCNLPGGASATLTRGFKIIGALGAASAKGYVREIASATAAEINKGRGRIVNDDATSPLVCLG